MATRTHIICLILKTLLSVWQDSWPPASFFQTVLMLTHNMKKSLIDTKAAKWIKSYFINGASHKHFKYIFVHRTSLFFSKSGVRFEIWTLSFFRASFDLSNLRGQIEKPQILLCVLMWKSRKIMVLFEVKVSILIIWGTRLSLKLSY